MKDIKNRKLLILSAELSQLRQKYNDRRTETLNTVLSELQIEYIFATGMYKGVPEKSFIAFPQNINEFETIKRIVLNNFRQESILLQTSDGKGYLIYSDPAILVPEYIGIYTEISEAQTSEVEAYTKTEKNIFVYIK